MTRKITFVVVGILVASFPSKGGSESAASAGWEPWKSNPTITVVSVESDSRLPSVDEAVAFWNDQFGEIGSAFRLGTISRVVREIAAYDLPFSRSGLSPKAREEQFKIIGQLQRVPGDIVIVLSEKKTTSFASVLPPPGRKIATIISADDATPRNTKNLPTVGVTKFNVSLNAIAHELGHVVGLDHNKEDGTLMCAGSPFCFARPPQGRIYPLSAAEKKTLLTWYPGDWKPRYGERHTGSGIE